MATRPHRRVTPCDDAGHHDAEQHSRHMCLPGDALGRIEEELFDEEECQDRPRRQIDELQSRREDHRKDASTRLQDQIRAHERGNRTGGPQQRITAFRVESDEREVRSNAAGDEQRQHPRRSDAFFDGTTEEPEEQHVAQKVQDAAVEEQCPHQRHVGVLRRILLGRIAGIPVACRASADASTMGDLARDERVRVVPAIAPCIGLGWMKAKVTRHATISAQVAHMMRRGGSPSRKG